MGMNFNFIMEPAIRWLNLRRPPSEVPLCNFERICKEIQHCDVLLIEGRSRVSEVIKLVTQSPWSHAALYIGRINEIEDPRLKKMLMEVYAGPHDVQLIIESELGQGTVVRPITVYAQEHIRICRPRGLTKADAMDVIRYALSSLGYDYDVRQILDLARFLFPWWIMPRRWRSTLFGTNIGNITKTVCSTLIAEAFSFVQFPILPLVRKDEENNVHFYIRNPRLTVPSLFDYSPYFDIIKYPYVDFDGGNKGYHNLPWRGIADTELGDSAVYNYTCSSCNENAPEQEAEGERDIPSSLR